MARFFIPRDWRLRNVVFFLIVLELPFTVANLALFGIASPNLYRTILWRIGGDKGFNSDPKYVLYAYANYRPVTIPLVWSSFNTQYHLVIGVLCMFFLIIKSCMWLLKVFPPLLSLALHAALLALWAYGIHVQTAPDTIDPARQNHGAPWYITKSCGIVERKIDRAYCMQAKSAFAVSCIMLSIYASLLLLTLYSLYPTASSRAARASAKQDQEKWSTHPHSPTDHDHDHQMSPEQQWQHMWELQQLPRTPGTAGGIKSPMTPRTRTYEELHGGGFHGGEAQYPEPGWYYDGAVQSAQGGYDAQAAEHEQVMSYEAGKGKGHESHAY